MAGVYVVYLFSDAHKTASICLAQGVSHFGNQKSGIPTPSKGDLPKIRQRARALRETLEIPWRFREHTISLGGSKKNNRATAYECGVVCARIYECDALPSESELRDDLTAMLALYQQVPSDYEEDVDVLVFAGGEQRPTLRKYVRGQQDNPSGKPSKDIDPDARRQKIERRKTLHRKVLDAVSLAAERAHHSGEESEYADLIVDRHWLIEVKSVGEKDAVARVRGAIAQLYHYKFLHRHDCPQTVLVAVFSRKPLTQNGSDELIRFMKECGIIVCWQEVDGGFASLDQQAPTWLVSPALSVA